MFPINSSFYVPFFYFQNQPILISNQPIFYPQMNIFYKTEINSHSNISFLPNNQIERQNSLIEDNSELYIPVKSQGKSKDFNKKIIIDKNYEKEVDSQELRQRLQRKLANRPKSYKTQKKMYMTANLPELGIIDNNQRSLRKRKTLSKRIKSIKSQNQKTEVSINYKETQEIQDCHNSKKNENLYSAQTGKKTSPKLLQIYNSEAQNFGRLSQNKLCRCELKNKKQNLLFRKFQQKEVAFQ